MARTPEQGGSVPSLPRSSELPGLISGALQSPIGQGILSGLQGLQSVAFDIPEGLLGLGLQKAASALPGAGRGREEQAVTDAVSSELEKLPAVARPFAAPLLYAAGAGEAKRIAQQRASLPSVEIGPAKFDLLDIAEGGLPIGGIAQGAVKAGRVVKAATKTPRGLIATRFDDLTKAGKTPEQAASDLAQEFGTQRVQRWAETGEDVAGTIAGPGAGVAQTAAGRVTRVTATETADAIEELARASKRRDLLDIAPDQRVLASKPANPVVSGTKSGTEQGRRLGVNPEKIEGLDQEVQDVILDTASRNAGFLAQRRGTLSIAEITGELSAKTGLTAERILTGKVGQAYNAEELWTLNRAMADSATRVSELRQLTATAAGNSDANKTKLVAAMVEQAALQQVFSGARTEAGRALRVLREVIDQGDALPSAYDRAFEAIGGRANADKLIDRLNAIWTDAKYSDADKLDWTFAFTRQLGKSSRFEKANELWVNSILSGLRTQEINLISNAAFALVQPPVRFLSAAIEAVTTVGGKTRPREIFFGDAAYGAFGLLRGVGPGLRKAVYRMRNGFEVGEATKFRETGQLGRPQAIGGKVGAVVNLPLRLLASTDDFFKTIGYQSELYAQAARAAGKERLALGTAEWSKRVSELIANPTDAMLKSAGDFSEYVTFTSRTGALTSGLIKMRDQFPVMRFIVPFITTPTNLLKRGAEFSPLGFAGAARAASGAERSTALARATIGSGIAAYFATLLADGRMTGSAPTSEAERDAFYRSGKIPYALKVGDQWVEFRRIEPLATELTWMAAAWETWQRDPNADLTTTAGRVASSIGRGVLDATYLDGIADFIDAIEDPQRYGGDWLSRLISGFVPFSSLTRSVAQATDPTIRKPESLDQQIAANLPGLSQGVPARLDAFGKPIERPESRQGIGAIVNPLLISRERQDRVEAELSQLSVPGGKDAQGKQRPPTPVLIGFTGDEIAGMGLSSEEARRYQEMAGPATYQKLEEIFSDPKYARMTQMEKVEAVTRAKADARRAARVGLAIEIADKSVTPEMLVRAAEMGFAASTTNIAKANFLAQLRKQNKLTPDVVREIERDLDPDELKVRDYLRGKDLVDAWNKAPAFVVGTRQAWQAADRARDQYAALIKGKSATERQRDAAVQRFYNSAAGGWLQILYEADGSRRTKYVHPTRRAIERDVLWERFAPKKPEPQARAPRPAPAIVATGR